MRSLSGVALVVVVSSLGACAVGAVDRPFLDVGGEGDAAVAPDPVDHPGFDASQPDLDASPPKPDAEVRSDAADAREPGPADDCRPSELGAAPTVLVRPGAPALFSVELGTAGPSWVSGCTGAFGPDRVVPVSVAGASRVVVSVDSTNDVTGNVVLYAKAQCGGPTDLACSATGRIEVPVSGSTPFFLHVDTVSAQPISARVTVFVETR
jgi:hypothetical protein